jgi:hypothetical protein
MVSVLSATILAIFAAGAAMAQEVPGKASGEQATDKAVEEAAQKTAEKVTEKVAEEAFQKAAEKAAQAAMEKADAEKTAKAELTSKRPDEWYGPTKVEFYIFVVDIDEIDGAAQNFTANIYLRLRWHDRRLASPGASPREMPLGDVWDPRALLANLQGLVTKSLPDVVHVDGDGTVTYYQRYTCKLSQPLLLQDFPMDTHVFTIQFAAAGYAADELTFVPDVTERAGVRIEGGAMADRLSLPDWQVLGHTTSTAAYQPIPGANAPGFAFEFTARRYLAYYIWQIVLPLAMVVVMSWTAFWLDTKDVGARVGVATSAILSLIAYRFVLASLLPNLPYMTRMDYLMVGSTLLVLLALIAVLLISLMRQRNREVGAEWLNLWARIGFPVAFVAIFIWFMSGAWLVK